MSQIYPIFPDFQKKAKIKEQDYAVKYKRSVENPLGFWQEEAERYITWFKPFDSVKQGGFTELDNLQWFSGGKLNVCYNCVDRHLPERAEQVALIWEGDNPLEQKKMTYAQLHQEVCRFSNVLKAQGIKKGDKVCIYLPMIPEVVVAMLSCARIGAVHSVVFAGFSPESLKTRINDADCKLVITADAGVRGNKIVPLKDNADQALKDCPQVEKVIVIKRIGKDIAWESSRDIWYHQAMEKADPHCEPEWMAAEDPLFILYTSGSTDKPKGILHHTAGYIVYAAITHHLIFDYHEKDIYWCTADVGWITGHTYLVYGPLCNGATTLVFEGVPHYPTYSRFWQIIDKHQVNIFYTAPTAIRALRHEGDHFVESTARTSLRLLGTVGEPINPEVWEWYYRVVGNSRCPVVDTWWQTETGGILMSPLPGAMPLKPGSAGKPFFGVVPAVVDEKGKLLPSDSQGRLVITQPWPGMMRTIYGNPQRFFNGYFKDFPGVYLTGDGAHYDRDGYYWITGRIDDVIKISGHRISTEEVESAFLKHPAVSEAAVAAIEHEIKGQAMVAFIIIKPEVIPSEPLKQALIQTIRQQIGAIAIPEKLYFVTALPKTRSGKIMRRILRKLANHEMENLGDLSTLVDPSVIDSISKEMQCLPISPTN
jgi:acetyl-CoA synthetase